MLVSLVLMFARISASAALRSTDSCRIAASSGARFAGGAMGMHVTGVPFG